MSAELRFSTWRDYYLIIQGFFYGSQGIAYGVALFIAAYFRSLGIDEGTALTYQAVILIPWYIKFLFGLLSDNVSVGKYGRRKPFVLLAALIGLGGWITLPLHQSFSVLVLVSATAASFGIALADASIDALAVDITPPRRRGSMQGVSWGFRAIGFGSSTLLAGPLVESGEWFYLFLIPGILSTVSSFAILLFEELPLPEDFSKLSGRVYKEVFGHGAIKLAMIFQIFSGAAIAIIYLMETFLSQELSYTASEIGRIIFSFGLGMFVGAILLGVLGDRIGFEKMITTLTGIYIAVIGGVFLVDLGQYNEVLVYFIVLGFINGGYEATQMRLSMDYSPPVAGGTMFNLYNSLSNIGQIAIGPLVVFALINYLPTKIGWQLFSVFLLIALLLALRVRSQYHLTEITAIGESELFED